MTPVVTNEREKKDKPEKKKPSVPVKPTNPREQTTERKKRRRRIRPEAILIKPGPGRQYAEVLKEVQRAVKPDVHDVKVKSIRQTKAGDILVEVRAKPEKRAEFGSAIEGVLGDHGSVRQLVPRAQVIIRDIIEGTEVAEVQEALKNFFGNEGHGSVKIDLSKRSNRGRILAFVEMDAAKAARLERSAQIKIGWTLCKVRAWTPEVRCYRCQESGHVAKNCTGHDRSNVCWKCGKEGHKAAACLEETEPRPPSRAKKKQ